jgi:hypothetical protein
MELDCNRKVVVFVFYCIEYRDYLFVIKRRLQ